MNSLQIFKNPEFGQIRMIEINGKPYAVGIDVAKALGYAIPHKAVRDNCKGVLTWNILTNGGEQEALIIPEGDIYRLIIKAADQSKNPEIKIKAEKFEIWVFDEILPMMRKSGGYIIEGQEEKFIETYFPTLSEETKIAMVKDLQRSINAMKPKADYFDALVERNLLTNFRDTAKELHIKERKFMKWLEIKGYIYRDSKNRPKPYSQFVPELFELKEFVNKNGYTNTQVLITPKGRETFRLLLKHKDA